MSDTAINYRRSAVGDRLGEWRLAERLGENACGEVWIARHRTLDRTAAVTVATDPAQSAVLRQCGLAHQAIDDPRVVHTLGLEVEHQPPYLVQEYVPAESLRAVLDRGPLAWGQALTIVREVLRALVAAHRRRVVHGALRPERILLPTAGGVRITGFGLPPVAAGSADAVVISDALDPEGVRRARDLEYLAPELRRGGAPTVVGDGYAVGVIGYELCTGDRPHGAETAHDVRPAVPADVAEVWRKATARVELRFPTAAAMLGALPPSTSGRAAPPAAVPVAYPTATPMGRIRITDAGADDADIRFTDGRVRCPACGCENPLGHRFCMRCGRALHAGAVPARACSHCRTTAPAHHRFCPRCGRELPDAAESRA